MNEVYEVPESRFSQNPANAAQNSADLAKLVREQPRFYFPRPVTIPIANALFIDRRGTEMSAVAGFAFQATVPRCPIVVRAERCKLLGIRNLALAGQARGTTGHDSGFVFEPAASDTFVYQCESVGHAAGGFHNFGSQYLRMDLCKSIDTKADGVHNTFGAGWAHISRHKSIRTGDDYFATVSYGNESLTHDILIEDSEAWGQLVTGRGATVIGGVRVTYRNMVLRDCRAFGINVNSEESYNTHGVDDVTLEKILIDGTGIGRQDPGNWPGVLVGGRAGGIVKNVTTKNITVRNPSGAKSQIRRPEFTQNIDLEGVRLFNVIE